MVKRSSNRRHVAGKALRGFSEDPTGDNGTMVVREVMRAVAAQAQQPENRLSIFQKMSLLGEMQVWRLKWL